MLTGSEGMLEMQRKATLQDTVREADFLCRKEGTHPYLPSLIESRIEKTLN
jgi:hypothetical protein